ncbi:hypothetical protein CC78DRAFT_529115 [Lojkania enalia]|uniref:Uncharacterized protein n=1 Tax=Lojkania enalia TaxID=147567 RepID=A0A9P4NB31_9PLEO|nr:hypothetical protein CC78DRAFT_529115 [Didymosphaeria enalia]
MVYYRHFRFVPAALAFSFAIVAFVFAILSITSKEWAVRDNFLPQDPPRDWKTPYYTLYRSPFQICTARQAQDPESGDENPPPPLVECIHYRPFGRNKTSCELEVVTQEDQSANVGDARLCQQIHYVGDFIIASTCFIGLGLITTGIMFLLTFLRTRERQRHSDNTRTATHINVALQLFFFIGFATGIISQFYAILAFIQSLPNQADFASSSGVGGSEETNVYGNHGPWYQGKGLSVYVTCAWAFAAAAGVTASRTWKLPNWSVLA